MGSLDRNTNSRKIKYPNFFALGIFRRRLVNVKWYRAKKRYWDEGFAVYNWRDPVTLVGGKTRVYHRSAYAGHFVVRFELKNENCTKADLRHIFLKKGPN